VAGDDGRTSMVDGAGPADDGDRIPPSGAFQMSSSSTPVTILAVLGAVIAVLGLFVAGNIVMVGIGLVAVFGAGLLDVIAIRRVRS
jgi:hypothetical protein